MLKKNPLEKHLRQGYEYLKKGEILKAKDEYLSALSLSPDNKVVLNNLSQIYAMINETEKSKGYSELLLKECERIPKSEISQKTLMLKSNALIALERYADASEVFDEILKINPQNHVILFQKSQYLEKNGNPKEALEYIDRILEGDEYNISANLSKARILTSLKEYETAEKYLSLVFKIDPKNPACLNLKSDLLKSKHRTTITPHDFAIKALDFWQMDDFEKSLAYLDKAVGLDSSFDEIWYIRGELLIRMGEINNAISSFKKAFKLNPESGGITKQKEFFKLLKRMKKVNNLLGLEK